MADDLDDMIRHAMKTLDATTPSGYFEALPITTLSRLEDGSSMEMQGNRSNDSSVTDTAPHLMMPPEDLETPAKPIVAAATPPKEADADREEDSGLHDIRNLASSTKARISSRRSTQSPVVTEDDVLASSSAGWKAVALPEPAKMISLPELSALPNAAVVKENDKASRTEAKRAKAAPVVADAAVANVATANDSLSTPMIGARIAQQQSGGRGKLYAVVGVLTAAAAGAGIYFMMSNKDVSPAAQVAAIDKAPAAPAPELQTAKAPAPAPVEPTAPAITAAPIVEAAAPVEEVKPSKKDTKEPKAHKVVIEDKVNVDKPVATKAVAVKEEIEPKAKGDEPSFDALLKEAGVDGNAKKDAKPSLDKKSLSSGDFKSGMAAVNGRAKGCYQGTQGTAAVKLTVAPSGEVTKVSVSGPFAGTPVAACVEGAVKAAKFPAWDGGPQSFGYSYLLAE